MAVSDYIGFGETIRYQFRTGLRYFLVKTGFYLLGIFILWWFLFQGTFIEIGLLVAAVWVVLYQGAIYITTIHLVTERSLYKIQGLFRKKTSAVYQMEIDNITTRQGILERVVFNTGEISIDIKGANQLYELTFKNISNPAQKQQRITQVWVEYPI